MAITFSCWIEPTLPDAVDALLNEALAEGHDWMADMITAWRSAPFIGAGEALFLAHAQDMLVGTAAISADPFVSESRTGRLRFIYVKAAARRCGIADQLIDRCLTRGRGRWDRVRLLTENPEAARLYERHGFRPQGGEARMSHCLAL